MTLSRLMVATLLGAGLLAAGSSALAQPPADATKATDTQSASVSASSASTSVSPLAAAVAAATAEPSADTLKKARTLGYKPEKRGGVTVFCKSETEIGSRFPTKHCIDGPSLDVVAEQQAQVQRQMGNSVCHCNCGGH